MTNEWNYLCEIILRITLKKDDKSQFRPKKVFWKRVNCLFCFFAIWVCLKVGSTPATWDFGIPYFQSNPFISQYVTILVMIVEHDAYIVSHPFRSYRDSVSLLRRDHGWRKCPVDMWQYGGGSGKKLKFPAWYTVVPQFVS